MENKNLILILVVIIAVLAIVFLGLFSQTMVRQDCKLEITSESKLYEGDPVSVKLTDLNNTPISGETVDIKITDGDMEVAGEKVTTDSKGTAKINLDLTKGKYIINSKFEGNNKFNGKTVEQKLSVDEANTESVSSQRTDTYPEYSSDLGYYKSAGIVQDEMMVVELDDGRYVIIAGDGYYNYEGMDSQGNIRMGSFLGHGGTKIG